MPMYELTLPPDAYSVKLKKDTYTYLLDIDTPGFTRTGIDGAELIIPLCGGDEFIGEVLERQWVKGWDTNIDAAQAFTAILDGSGTLELEGEADAAGTWGFGWIDGQHPIVLMDETEVTVSLSVPVDDTGGTANRDLEYTFWLTMDKQVVTPSTSANTFLIRITVDENGLLLELKKEINGVTTIIFNGSTYDDGVGRATGDLEGTIWRIVFHESDEDNDYRHIHVYLKQSDTIANAESATENELTTSPYDISDLYFEVVYPAYRIGSQNTTYYDSSGEAKSTYLRVDYPDFDLKYLLSNPESEEAEGRVELWDGDPDVSGSQRVRREDYVFTDDIYLQNGLIRIFLDELTYFSPRLFAYIGAVWTRITERITPRLANSGQSLYYCKLVRIVKVTDDEVILHLRFHEDATDDEDYTIDYNLTMKRGEYSFDLQFIDAHPDEGRYWYTRIITNYRFVYGQDDYIADNDITITFSNPSPEDYDNYLSSFDEGGLAAILSMSINTTTGSIGGNAGLLTMLGTENETITISVTPFPLITNLFEEAEDATLSGGSTTPGNDPNASGAGNNYVLLNAQNEIVDYTVVAGTALPEGRYIAYFRALDNNQVANDFEMSVYNSSDSEYRNEENTDVHTTLTAAYAYYGIVFDITAADVTGTNNIRIRAKKDTAGANSIRVDYFLIIPIADGANLPQDLVHAAARLFSKPRRVLQR